MTTKRTDLEIEAIRNVLDAFPEGLRIREMLEQSSGLSCSERTMRRRMDLLLQREEVTRETGGVFRLNRQNAGNEAHPEWMSKGAVEIRKTIRRPIADRMPVGYQRKFLEDYVPNQTHYLSTTLREEFAEMGQVGITDLPAGTYIRQIMDRLLIDLSWNSSRLEGNTYSLLETERLLTLGEGVDGKATRDAQMILNHKAAIEMLVDDAEAIGFNRFTICNLHALLSDNLLDDQAACGRLRFIPVGIGGTVFHPLEVPQLIEEQFLLLLEKASQIENAFEQAFFVMVHFPYLQPFEDVNKRVSRLAANIPLIRHNLCPLSFADVSKDDYITGLLGVYELNRVELLRDVFRRAYRRSCARYAAVRHSLGDPDPFRLKYRGIIGKLVRGVVLAKMGKWGATKWISAEAQGEIESSLHLKLISAVEEELSSLHEGNIARFRLYPSEFEVWKEKWEIPE